MDRAMHCFSRFYTTSALLQFEELCGRQPSYVNPKRLLLLGDFICRFQLSAAFKKPNAAETLPVLCESYFFFFVCVCFLATRVCSLD